MKSKIKIINGYKYSKKSFNNYKLQLKIKLIDIKGEDHVMVLYTTQTNVSKAHSDLITIVTNKVASFKIIHSATKNHVDATSKLIDEI